MLHFGMLFQIHHRLYNFGNACLVISAEQCVTISHDDVLANVVEQFGELLRRRDNAFAQYYILAVVVADNTRLDVCTRAVGTGVHVGDKAYDWHIGIGVGWKCGVDVAMFVHLYFGQTLADEFVLQILGKHELLRCTRTSFCLFVRLRVVGHISEESAEYLFHIYRGK